MIFNWPFSSFQNGSSPHYNKSACAHVAIKIQVFQYRPLNMSMLYAVSPICKQSNITLSLYVQTKINSYMASQLTCCKWYGLHIFIIDTSALSGVQNPLTFRRDIYYIYIIYTGTPLCPHFCSIKSNNDKMTLP